VKKPMLATLAALTALLNLPLLAANEKVLRPDIVVVGAGASGTAAALEAAEHGAKVLVLEKQAVPGGTGNMAEGLFAAESSLQQRQGIIVTRDMAFKTIMDYSHWLANPRIAMAFVNRSADTIDWLKGEGVKFEYIGPGGPGGPLTWHVMVGQSRQMLSTLRERFAALGGEILLETPGQALIQEKGRVTGILAQNKAGDHLRIEAKAVIIATGGFANNKEMLKKYARYPEVIPVGNVGKDGDGLRMAWAAGAAQDTMITQSYRPGLAGFAPNSHLIAAAVQPYLWVDTKGIRYTDESTVVLWPYSTNKLEKIGGTAYSIYDEATRKFLEDEKGIPIPMGEWLLTNTKLTKLDKELAAELAKNNGNVVKADTLEGLAQALKMDPAALKATVAVNNQDADSHQDSVFGKNPIYQRAMRTPPFYATKLHPRDLGTLGGVMINEQMQAVTPARDPIPGLYVVGNDASGMYGDSYDLLLGGGTLGFAVNSGRIAADHAVLAAGIRKP
jgi:fumarate reductase flavoprotein subunit